MCVEVSSRVYVQMFPKFEEALVLRFRVQGASKTGTKVVKVT